MIRLVASFYDEGMVADAGQGLASETIARLRRAGYAAFLAGGCVRDLLLGRVAKDFDVTTAATPDQIAALFPDAIPVGAHFGVMLLKRGEAQVEVATFRSDHDYQDGRHPGHVQFETDPRQDVLRRDFTINALLMDPATGEILDSVGGRDDLAAGLVRAIGEPDRRFGEDYLRLLRGVRFAARLDFAIEPATLQAMVRHRAGLQRISAERVRDELTRILTEGNAKRGFELLDQSGLLAEVLPEVKAMQGVEQPPQYHPEGDVWVHTLLLLQNLRQPSRTLAWGALLHDVGKPVTFERAPDRIRFNGHAQVGADMANALCQRLRFSAADSTQTVALVANHMRFGDVRQMRESTLKRFLRLPLFDEHLELHRLDCLGSHRKLELYDFVADRRASLSEEQLAPPRLVTGEDLIRLGLRPGPAFASILHEVEDAQLEGELTTREQALAYVARHHLAPGAVASGTTASGSDQTK